jgi:hypothetical protein
MVGEIRLCAVRLASHNQKVLTISEELEDHEEDDLVGAAEKWVSVGVG